MSSGSLAGFPVVDVKTTLYDGSYHDVDSSVLAFQVRGEGSTELGPWALNGSAQHLPRKAVQLLGGPPP